MRWAWAAWWLLLPLCVLVQWPSRSVMASTSMNWAAMAAVAGVLSCLETRDPRRVILPIAVPVGLALVFNHLWKVLPQIIPNEGWFDAFGVISAFGSTAAWCVFLLFGTLAVLRYSPDFSKRLAPALFAFHAVNCLFFALHVFGFYDFWKYSSNSGGILPSMKLWAVWAGISIPILWGWKKWAVIPAVIALVFAKAVTVCVALGLLGIWASAKLRRWAVLRNWAFGLAGVLALFLWRYPFEVLWNRVELRFFTWFAAFDSICLNPFGLGWEPSAWNKFVLANYARPVMSHTSSDVLMVIVRNGWVALPVLWWVWSKANEQARVKPLDLAVMFGLLLAFIQSSLSVAPAGLLAWAVWLLWKINRYDCEEKFA